MKKIWKVHESNTRLQKNLSSGLGISPVFAQVLINRGIHNKDAARDFLFGDLSSCHDPFLMKDMGKSVHRIKKAISGGEKILIYGDYDVDGVTSTALLSCVLKKLGANYDTFIPNRLDEGYGLNIQAVTLAKESGVDLIITVDCGINSVKEVACANDHGIDVILTDHHVPKEDERPPAYASVDPHQEECTYPFPHLAGVGVAYKLAVALNGGSHDAVKEHLDLVSLGTIADIVPLTGENRILAKQGLKELRNTERAGLKALMEVARIKQDKLTCRDVGFALGPRINAMGRVGSAATALDLFMCNDINEARHLSGILDRENKNRQKIEREIQKNATQRVRDEIDTDKDKVIVLADEDWHPGVIGIVASRLTEEFNKPAILIALEGDEGKGSGRSVDGFNLLGAVDSAKEALIDFGGHKAACGVKIRKQDIGLFRELINNNADDHFSSEEGSPEMSIDACIPFSHIGSKLVKELGLLMPHGRGNDEPVFSTNSMKVKNRPREIGKSGFKFLATCGNLTYEAVTFRKNSVDRPRMGDTINLAYAPSINSWGGIDTIQLNIKDIEIVGE